MFGWVTIVIDVVKAFFGIGGSKESSEAVQAGNAGAANADLQVTKTSAEKEAAIAQAAVDTPEDGSALVKSLRDGNF